MNLPNKLTLTRLVLTGAFLVSFFTPLRFGETVALIIFTAAGLTDHYDGKIARRRNMITNFGILMDPLADKILTCSAFIAFVERGMMPAWMAILIVARELAITGLRLLAASRNIVLAAENCGKHKTTSQIVAIVALLVLASYEQWGAWGAALFGFPVLGTPWIWLFAELSKWVAVMFTVLSGGLYLWRNRNLYLSDL